MNRKIPSITLSGPRLALRSDSQVYVVLKITDSIEFDPGTELTKKQVGELCADNNWKVTITKL